jgi:hypothetical protein
MPIGVNSFRINSNKHRIIILSVTARNSERNNILVLFSSTFQNALRITSRKHIFYEVLRDDVGFNWMCIRVIR